MQQSTPRRGVFVALLMVVAVALIAAVLAPSARGRASAAENGPSPRAVGDESNGWTVAFSAPAYPNGEPFHFYNMTFVTRDLGYAYGGQSWNASDSDANGQPINPGRVYRTKDGGATWQLVHESRGWKIGMACADEKRCWVGGKRGQIVYTQDGGDTWFGANEYTWQGMDAYPTPAVQTPVPFTAWIRSAGITTDASSIIFGATDNTVLHSKDGVNFYNYWPLLSWYSATWSMTCTNATTCYGGQIKRQVIKTTNGGDTWFLAARVGTDELNANCLSDKYPPEGIQRRYYGIAFANESYGWVAGSCGLLYRTINAAQGWIAQNDGSIPETTTFRRLQAFSRWSVVAVGGTNPDPADASMTQNAIIYTGDDDDKDGKAMKWVQVAAPDTSELHGLAGFSDATFVADWSGNIWRWEGSLVPMQPTRTPTTTPTVTETPEATETPTATATPTATTSAGAQIEVIAFHDFNLNNQPDESDAKLANVGFQVSKNAAPVATGATGLDGRKTFTGLSAGEYVVAITTPAVGYTANYNQLVVGLSENGSVTLPFSHRMSTVTPTRAKTWLPLTLR